MPSSFKTKRKLSTNIIQFVLVVFILMVEVCTPLAAQDGSISRRSKAAVNEVQQIDEILNPLIIEYHKNGNDPKLELKLRSLLNTRAPLARKMKNTIKRDKNNLVNEKTKVNQSMAKLYKNLKRLEVNGSQKKIDEAITKHEVERERLSAFNKAIEEYELLSKKWEFFEKPKNIGLPNGVFKELPVFETGAAAGNFMYYVGNGYDAMMSKDGIMYISVLPDEPSIIDGGKIMIGVMDLSVMGFIPPSLQPLKQPAKMILRGFLENYAQFTLVYTFMPRFVTISCGHLDPIDIVEPTDFILKIRIPPKDSDPNEAKLILKIVESGRTTRAAYPYNDNEVYSLNGVVKSAKIRSHWGASEILIKSKRTRENFTVENNAANHIRKGYTFCYKPDRQELVHQKSSITLSIILND